MQCSAAQCRTCTALHCTAVQCKVNISPSMTTYEIIKVIRKLVSVVFIDMRSINLFDQVNMTTAFVIQY